MTHNSWVFLREKRGHSSVFPGTWIEVKIPLECLAYQEKRVGQSVQGLQSTWFGLADETSWETALPRKSKTGEEGAHDQYTRPRTGLLEFLSSSVLCLFVNCWRTHVSVFISLWSSLCLPLAVVWLKFLLPRTQEL